MYFEFYTLDFLFFQSCFNFHSKVHKSRILYSITSLDNMVQKTYTEMEKKTIKIIIIKKTVKLSPNPTLPSKHCNKKHT